jgi:hypothetical protein
MACPKSCNFFPWRLSSGPRRLKHSQPAAKTETAGAATLVNRSNSNDGPPCPTIFLRISVSSSHIRIIFLCSSVGCYECVQKAELCYLGFLGTESAESAQLSLLDGTRQAGDWAKILFRISREFATKGDVMNGEKENQERLSFLLLARSLASL